MVDYGVRRNLNNLVAPIAVFLYKLKNKLPLELCLAVIIMQYGPNLPERHVPNGQVPNYLPIPYAPTYLPTTQRSDMVPPLTMQYGPNLPEHHVPNGQVPNYLPIPVPNYLPIPYPPTYHPTTQHGDMVPPLTMQYGPTLPEHYVPNGQVPNYLPIPVPNYLPIPYPPTYLPTTQHSDVVPPLTMQYGP